MEYGATVAIDIGLASGMVYARGGVFYSSADDHRGNQVVVFEAYFRAGGALSVIGLINVFIEFYVGLGFVSRNGQSYAEGVARLTVRIEILFFSIAVTLEMRKTIAGSRSEESGDRGPMGQVGSAGPADLGEENGRSGHRWGRPAFSAGAPLSGRDWVAETRRWDRHLALVGLEEG
jgi:hypothetical protein